MSERDATPVLCFNLALQWAHSHECVSEGAIRVNHPLQTRSWLEQITRARGRRASPSPVGGPAPAGA
eukprot:8062293-Pyramimonas_sp.AAC.1